MNNITIIGRIVQDVKVERVGDKQTPVINNAIAVDRKFAKDEVDFFDFVVWDQLAEKVVGPYAKKGDEIALQGYLKQNRYQNDAGENRSRVEIVVQEVKLLNNNRPEQEQ